MSTMLVCEKAMLQEGRRIAANGKYLAKTQVHVIADTCDFHLSSENIDLSGLPVLEPVSLTASVQRMGGGKGFFVLQIDAIEVKPLIPAKK